MKRVMNRDAGAWRTRSRPRCFRKTCWRLAYSTPTAGRARRTRVGGDFYDVLTLPDGRIVIALGEGWDGGGVMHPWTGSAPESFRRRRRPSS